MVWALSNTRSSLRRATIITSCFESEHTIEPGTPEHGTTEHGTPAEQRNNAGLTENRNNGTRNSRGIAGITEDHKATTQGQA